MRRMAGPNFADCTISSSVATASPATGNACGIRQMWSSPHGQRKAFCCPPIFCASVNPAELAAADITTLELPHLGTKFGGWRPVGESNPCCRNENPES